MAKAPLKHHPMIPTNGLPNRKMRQLKYAIAKATAYVEAIAKAVFVPTFILSLRITFGAANHSTASSAQPRIFTT
jgi:hypothetical protein